MRVAGFFRTPCYISRVPGADAAVSADCPSENEVLALVRGGLDADAASIIQGHIDGCATCQELFAALLGATESPLLDSGARSSRRGTDVLAAGAEFGRYRIRDVVGAGAMGIVYLAEDPKLQRPVAIKVLRNQNDEASSRLLREAQALARLSHPNVIVVHEVGTVAEQVFMAMEFVEGSSLTNWLARETRTSTEILEHFTQAGRGLEKAHEAELVHRDFKPDNVLVGKDGRVRVVDFGLAREGVTLTSMTSAPEPDATDIGRLMTLTQTGAFIGTPAYMAPEQYEGKRADARSDQFSFAVALFEALYGRRPYFARTLHELSVAVRTGDLRIPKTTRRIPRHVERALLRALEVNPEKRFPSMRALLTALAKDEKAPIPKVTTALAIVSVLAGAAGGAWAYATRAAPPTRAVIMSEATSPAVTRLDATASPSARPMANSVDTVTSANATATTTSTAVPPLAATSARAKSSVSPLPSSVAKGPSEGAKASPAASSDLFDTVR